MDGIDKPYIALVGWKRTLGIVFASVFGLAILCYYSNSDEIYTVANNL